MLPAASGRDRFSFLCCTSFSNFTSRFRTAKSELFTNVCINSRNSSSDNAVTFISGKGSPSKREPIRRSSRPLGDVFRAASIAATRCFRCASSLEAANIASTHASCSSNQNARPSYSQKNSRNSVSNASRLAFSASKPTRRSWEAKSARLTRKASHSRNSSGVNSVNLGVISFSKDESIDLIQREFCPY